MRLHDAERDGKTAPRTPRTPPAGRTASAPAPDDLSPAGVLALQRAAGNASVARMVALRGGAAGTGTVVQTAPTPPPVDIQIGPNLPPNPRLWTDFMDHFYVGPISPGSLPEGYTEDGYVEQFCAYLSTYWLTHGQSQSGLTFSQLDEATQRAAAMVVREWAGGGGLNAQVQYAIAQTGGHSVPLSSIQADAQNGTLPAGTTIWFGSDYHAEAAVVTQQGRRYLMYDPNTGVATSRDTTGFLSYIATKNAFVVRPGPNADEEGCKCCAIM